MEYTGLGSGLSTAVLCVVIGCSGAYAQDREAHDQRGDRELHITDTEESVTELELPEEEEGTDEEGAVDDDDGLSEFASFFEGAHILAGPTIVDCTLSEGTETSCYSITIDANEEPAAYTLGPWCPTHITDGPELGGLWVEDGEVYDVDGAFVENLADFYDDDGWMMYDLETGDINYSAEELGCEIAGNVDFDGTYTNYCVECLPEYLDELSKTFVIPIEPVLAEATVSVAGSGAGVAFSGILLDGPAPVGGITSTYTIGPFDDCGGHINPFSGYHHHAVTDCLNNMAISDDHASRVGIAMDGHSIYSHLNTDGTEPDDLDACNGHATEDLDYHYHAGSEGSNAIVGCFVAEAGCTLDNETDGICDATTSVAPGPPDDESDEVDEVEELDEVVEEVVTE